MRSSQSTKEEETGQEELPPFPTELLPSVHVPNTCIARISFSPASPIYAAEATSRVSLHPYTVKFLGPNSESVQSDVEILEVLTSTFSAPMTAHLALTSTTLTTVCICMGLLLQFRRLLIIFLLWHWGMICLNFTKGGLRRGASRAFLGHIIDNPTQGISHPPSATAWTSACCTGEARRLIGPPPNLQEARKQKPPKSP